MLDERERAAKLLREWLASDPGQTRSAEHMLVRLRMPGKALAVPERASDAYVCGMCFDVFLRPPRSIPKLEKLLFTERPETGGAGHCQRAAGTPAGRLRHRRCGMRHGAWIAGRG
jgi:hypothetical protein